MLEAQPSLWLSDESTSDVGSIGAPALGSMQPERVIERIQRGRIIAILRGDFAGRAAEIGAVLFETGITAVEVTLNSLRALESIRQLVARCGSSMAVGAGTVLQPDDVERAAGAGAQFIVSPNRDLQVIAAAKRRGLASFPGCFTPSETVEALDAGADGVKIFPAECLGPSFVKAMRGPFPKIRLIPTGGVTPETTRTYLTAGAWAVGVGSELLGKGVEHDPNLEKLRERARAFVAAAQSQEV